MRVMHVCYFRSPPKGVLKQIKAECSATKLHEVNWDTVLYTEKGPIHPFDYKESSSNSNFLIRIINVLKLRIKFFIWLRCQLYNYDLVLLRYTAFDVFQFMFFLFNKKKNILTVHHTKELEMLNSIMGDRSKLLKLLFKLIERLTELILKRKVSGLVAVTSEILEYESHRFNFSDNSNFFLYPNGVMPLEKRKKSVRYDGLNIVFIASQFYDWHGLDLLFKSSLAHPGNYTIHLIGKLTQHQEVYIKKDKRFKVWGLIDADEISTIMSGSDIGLSSLALDRNGMKQACTLKVREYLSHGLPVYAGYQDVFPRSFPYYKFGTANIEQILDFARWSKTQTNDKVVSLSLKYIDKCVLVKKVYNEFEQVFKG